MELCGFIYLSDRKEGMLKKTSLNKIKCVEVLKPVKVDLTDSMSFINSDLKIKYQIIKRHRQTVEVI